MTEWQPIETAPKDNTDILVFGQGVIRTAFWCKKTGKHRVNAHSFVALDPTHWMPLPAPPAQFWR